MNNRNLCKLFLVVLTLHFVRSNKKWPNIKCLRIIQNDAYNIIHPHLKNHNISCRYLKQHKKDITCILDWALDENCEILEDIRKLIRNSSENCTERPALKAPIHCSLKSFRKCWCGFMQENLQNSQ